MWVYISAGMSVLEAALLKNSLTCSKNLGSPFTSKYPFGTLPALAAILAVENYIA
jgi:hypothetical protein